MNSKQVVFGPNTILAIMHGVVDDTMIAIIYSSAQKENIRFRLSIRSHSQFHYF